ncbi:sialate O-acetylesterase [Dysgonomonas alginatilytica]|uniref:Sialate O-acetylesterase n=1 Tax=Dysgonomonas alginatilytica TaxID=1605892 RepID=A0A2V3PR98_9BACT|nr:sialate O-acetylesterase [Dysgonomonas alginatilytica]PXV66330.1 sialate O-acetylesterase [Dysgonomonas alginatilytica]
MKTINKYIPTRRVAFLMLLTLFCVVNGRASVKLPALISDGMVLQRDTELKLWGWASVGESIEISFLNKSYKTTADANGKWEVTLPPQKAGGPYQMQINNISINDILIGDVWLCSGQSNMETPIRRVLDLYKDEVSLINNPYIRHLKTPLKYNFTGVSDDINGGSWKSATPENILDFSAVAYFFAKELYDKYKVPIGLLNSSVGGSPVEAWLSRDALKQFPSYLQIADQFAVAGYIDSIRTREKKMESNWYSTLNKNDKGVSNWFKSDLNTSDWGTISLPGYWADKGVGNINGSFWFRKDFEVPASMVGKPAVLRLGCIVDSDSTYINGEFVGTISYQYPPRIYTIPLGLLHEGTNSVTLRVINSIGKGGFVEDKPYQIIVGDELINLTGEWKYKLGAEMSPLKPQTFFQYNPMGLYNGMIAPLINYPIKGVIWYQGEANTSRPAEYSTMLSALINDWRTKWNKPDLPFIITQLPNFMKVEKQPSESNWAMLREAQSKVLEIPNTGMAVTIDLGEWNDVHPLKKKEVGYRLALPAMKIAYGDKKIISSAPVYNNMVIEGDKIILSFKEIGNGFAANEKLKGFAIAGKDKQFVWADAKIEGNKIIVSSDKVKNPVAVRYAWADNPEGANLRNKESLPSSPFRTDNW